MRFDVVVGNPPYTHLRNMNNRKYAKYPRQRDMAQVFVRWALDNITVNGVISYNVTESWLNVKTSDGAKETRTLVNGKIREVIKDESVENYSMNDGGDIRTFIVCLSDKFELLYNFNNEVIKYDDIYIRNFCDQTNKQKLHFKNVNFSKFISSFPRCEGNKVGTNFESFSRDVYFDDDGDDWFLFCKYNQKQIERGNWKIVKTNDFLKFSKDKLESRIRRGSVEKCLGLFLVGYLATGIGVFETSYNSSKANHDVKQLSTDGLLVIRVPDFDYYKESHPEQFNNYMKWVEDNMVDKDKFLAGIDEQFELLIS